MKFTNLKSLRKTRNRSQAEVAGALQLSQSAISKLESRADVSLRVLRSYITALGGTLEVLARFPDGEMHLTVPPTTSRKRSSFRRLAEGQTELPADWQDEVNRIRALTPEQRMQELANISALYASMPHRR